MAIPNQVNPPPNFVARAKRLASLVRLRPFDTTTPQGRADERHRRIALTAATSLVGKLIDVITLLIVVRLTLRYLGPERYGLWMTINSLVAMLIFADLGIGSGLVNAISHGSGKQDTDRIARFVSSGFFMLCAVGLVIIAVLLLICPFVPWAGVFNVTTQQASDEAAPAVAILVISFAIHLPLGVIQRVQAGLQQGFATNAWQAIAKILSLGLILLAIGLRAGLPWLIAASVIGSAFTLVINGIVSFAGTMRPIRPRWRLFSASTARQLLKLGMLFFVLNIATALAFSSDNLVAARVCGAESVAQYTVPMRLFSLPGLLLGMLLAPLWPAYGEALSRGDVPWAARTLGRSLILTLVASAAAAALLCIFGVPIIHLWVGPAVTPSTWLLLGMGAFTVLGACGNALGAFLNGANVFRFQAISAMIMAVTNLALSILLAYRAGIAGIIWGTVISYSLCTIVPSLCILPKILRSAATGASAQDTTGS